MARKRHKPEEIVAKLRQVDVLTGQGTLTFPRKSGHRVMRFSGLPAPV